MPLFHGDNAISASDPRDAFMDFIRYEEVEHLDVLFKCFASLKKDEWKLLTSLVDNRINTLDDCRDNFFSRWLEKIMFFPRWLEKIDGRFLLKYIGQYKEEWK